MKKLGIHNPQTGIELRAFQERLHQLGLESTPDGTIDPRSVEGLRLGKLKNLEALKAVLDPSGNLDAEGATKLTKARTVAGFEVGRNASIDEAQSRAVRSIAMSLDGLNATISKTLSALETSDDGEVKLDLGPLAKIRRKLNAIDRQWAASSLSTPAVGRIDPGAMRALGKSLGGFGEASARLIGTLSELRSFIVESKQRSWVGVLASNWILETLSSSVGQLQEMQRTLTIAANKVASPTSPAEQELSSFADRAKVDGATSAQHGSAASTIGDLIEQFSRERRSDRL